MGDAYVFYVFMVATISTYSKRKWSPVYCHLCRRCPMTRLSCWAPLSLELRCRTGRQQRPLALRSTRSSSSRNNCSSRSNRPSQLQHRYCWQLLPIWNHFYDFFLTFFLPFFLSLFLRSFLPPCLSGVRSNRSIGLLSLLNSSVMSLMIDYSNKNTS